MGFYRILNRARHDNVCILHMKVMFLVAFVQNGFSYGTLEENSFEFRKYSGNVRECVIKCRYLLASIILLIPYEIFFMKYPVIQANKNVMHVRARSY